MFSGDAYILDTATMSWFQLTVPLIQRLGQFIGTNNIDDNNIIAGIPKKLASFEHYL